MHIEKNSIDILGREYNNYDDKKVEYEDQQLLHETDDNQLISSSEEAQTETFYTF